MKKLTEFTVQSYMDGLRSGTLKGSRCLRCGKQMLPPRPVCPGCGSTMLEWVTFGGSGTVAAVTTIRVPLTRFSDRGDYSVGIVTLDEGVHISGLLTGEDVQIGSRVKAAYEQVGESPLLVFAPV